MWNPSNTIDPPGAIIAKQKMELKLLENGTMYYNEPTFANVYRLLCSNTEQEQSKKRARRSKDTLRSIPTSAGRHSWKLNHEVWNCFRNAIIPLFLPGAPEMCHTCNIHVLDAMSTPWTHPLMWVIIILHWLWQFNDENEANCEILTIGYLIICWCYNMCISISFQSSSPFCIPVEDAVKTRINVSKWIIFKQTTL